MFTVHLRSFHPWENFSWGGIYYEGDHRPFSNDVSDSTTSRIKYSVPIDPWRGVIGGAKVLSDPSNHALASEETYDRTSEKPWHITSMDSFPEQIDGGGNIIKPFTLHASYHGRNFATFAPDNSAGDILNNIMVPVLDVRTHTYFECKVDAATQKKSIEVSVNVLGDRFPNSEGLLVDENGKAVFLFTTVRDGPAIQTLPGEGYLNMARANFEIELDGDFNFSGSIVEFSDFFDYSPSVTRHYERHLSAPGKGYDLINTIDELNHRHANRETSPTGAMQAG